jgi:hypothetical protein
MLWTAVILLWLGACGAVLALIPSNDLSPFPTVRRVIGALIVVLIVEEAFRTLGGLKERIVTIAIGGLFWLFYWGLVWTTGGWKGGWQTGLVGASLRLGLGVALVLVCWFLARAEAARTSAVPRRE